MKNHKSSIFKHRLVWTMSLRKLSPQISNFAISNSLSFYRFNTKFFFAIHLILPSLCISIVCVTISRQKVSLFFSCKIIEQVQFWQEETAKGDNTQKFTFNSFHSHVLLCCVLGKILLKWFTTIYLQTFLSAVGQIWLKQFILTIFLDTSNWDRAISVNG